MLFSIYLIIKSYLNGRFYWYLMMAQLIINFDSLVCWYHLFIKPYKSFLAFYCQKGFRKCFFYYLLLYSTPSLNVSTLDLLGIFLFISISKSWTAFLNKFTRLHFYKPSLKFQWFLNALLIFVLKIKLFILNILYAL